jgi:hypothetical protein
LRRAHGPDAAQIFSRQLRDRTRTSLGGRRQIESRSLHQSERLATQTLNVEEFSNSGDLRSGVAIRRTCDRSLDAECRSLRAVKFTWSTRGRIGDMIRCVRIWTASDGDSHFEEGVIDLHGGNRGDFLSVAVGAVSLSFRETKSGGYSNGTRTLSRDLSLPLAGFCNSRRAAAKPSSSGLATSFWPKTTPALDTAGSSSATIHGVALTWSFSQAPNCHSRR